MAISVSSPCLAVRGQLCAHSTTPDEAYCCTRRFLCTGGSDASLAIVDVDDLVASCYVHCDAAIAEVSISPDARWVAFSEAQSPGIHIASVETGAWRRSCASACACRRDAQHSWVAGRIVQRIETQGAVTSLVWNPNPPWLPVLVFAGGTSYDSRGDSFGPVCIYAGPGK